MKRKPRNLILRLNKYQHLIIYPVLIACLGGALSSILCLLFAYYPDSFLVFKNIPLSEVRYHIPKILMVTNAIMIIVIFWTYYMSNKLVGPFERIVKHLDDIAEGKTKEPLGIRKGDEMFEELTKRINSIIKRL